MVSLLFDQSRLIVNVWHHHANNQARHVLLNHRRLLNPLIADNQSTLAEACIPGTQTTVCLPNLPHERSPNGLSYTEDTLNAELTRFLSAVEPTEEFAPPIVGCKAIIAPHAGYSYSGPAAAWAYKSIATTGIKRVFILGPSHHVHLRGCALSVCSTYRTPVGDLPLDLDVVKELRDTGKFDDMSIDTDQKEHSIEMHLPYVRKVFESSADITIVPVLVGALSQQKEREYGAILAPYLEREDTIFVISSDFCHWGTRFGYTFYYSKPLPSDAPSVNLSTRRSGPAPAANHPIHASISDLDHEAMQLLAIPSGSGSARAAHDGFAAYLQRTENTICGRHPIGVLLGALTALEEGKGEPARSASIKWVRYEQSSQCFNVGDSSVSYASAFVTL
ncbi:MEMO1 family [Hygrophoropsis aurantiaca]|uniref:MEMO1 family n=1 Tax=Hygrophoropsis aurantiaca TaxID=72124 RepID=A0ACB8AS29_9AGAM|nr:MEMO1 family [Hygrophoropsis aurantiaca]